MQVGIVVNAKSHASIHAPMPSRPSRVIGLCNMCGLQRHGCGSLTEAEIQMSEPQTRNDRGKQLQHAHLCVCDAGGLALTHQAACVSSQPQGQMTHHSGPTGCGIAANAGAFRLPRMHRDAPTHACLQLLMRLAAALSACCHTSTGEEKALMRPPSIRACVHTFLCSVSPGSQASKQTGAHRAVGKVGLDEGGHLGGLPPRPLLAQVPLLAQGLDGVVLLPRQRKAGLPRHRDTPSPTPLNRQSARVSGTVRRE